MATKSLKQKAKRKSYATKSSNKQSKKMTAEKKYANGTTYKDSSGKTHKRVAFPGTKRGDAYCARSSGQKKTPKVRARRKAWGCKGKKSSR